MDTFNAKVEKGKLVFEAPIRVANHLNLLNGQKVEVVIRKLRSQRSNNQNNYYWGCVLDILSKETGYEIDDLHEIMKYKFLKQNRKTGMEYVKSTSKLSTSEFEEYLEKIRRWASIELSIFIPDPM